MPVTAESTFYFFWQISSKSPSSYRVIPGCFRSGVSLHSHTMFSEESLEMVPRYTAKMPYVAAAISRQQTEYNARNGCEFDFSKAYWTPPLTPRQAYRLEEKQIQRKLELSPLVSLTDHDDIRAAGLLHVLHRSRYAPISTEWSIPFGPTFFHLGVHNLPAEEAKALHAEMADYTADPAAGKLSTCLEKLNAYPNVLLILNHALWDEKGVGPALHNQTLSSLLETHGAQIHALEVNGLRPWRENKTVISIARSLNLPVVSGGDRHGREPNAILNLSGAPTFHGFVEEVRYRRKSHVIFMQQYREPLKLRILQTIVDVLRDYPENAEGRRLWSDRVLYRDPVNGTMSLTTIWRDGGPGIVQHFVRATRLLEWGGLQSALRLALNYGSTAWSKGEVSI